MNPILIQSLITLVGILLTAFLTYYFSQRRYHYKKLFDRKLAYLEEIYGEIVSLENDLRKYIFISGSDMRIEFLAKKQEEISMILTKLFELQKNFWKKEIILDQSSTLVTQSFLDVLIEILSNLKSSIISQQVRDPKTAFKQWDRALQIMQDKLLKTKEQLKKDFRKVTEI